MDARLEEAREHGWLREFAGLQVSRAAAEQKLDAMRQLADRHHTAHLGMPDYRPVAGRTSRSATGADTEGPRGCPKSLTTSNPSCRPRLPRPESRNPPARLGPSPEAIDAMAKALAPHLPDLSKIISPAVIDGIGRIQANLVNINKAIAPYLVNVQAALSKVVLPDLSGVQAVVAGVMSKFPPNWPLEPDLLEGLFDVVQTEGIPLVWVPRKDIVTDVLRAANRDERIRILLDRRADVIQDCREVLATVTHTDLANQIPLATNVIDAFEAGHDQAAQALAVVVTETVVSRSIDKKYTNVVKSVKIEDWGDLSIPELRLKTALAAIGPFYVTWFPNQDTPVPTELSRHVTVHQADASHYTHGNAIVAVMLVIYILRAVQELLEQP